MSPRALSLSIAFVLVLAAWNTPQPLTTSAPQADASSSAAPSAATIPAPSSAAYLAGLALLAPSPSSSAPIPLSPRAVDALNRSLRSAVSQVAYMPHRVVEDMFVLAAADGDAPLDDAAELTRKTLDALYSGPLRHKPEDATLVWICTKATFAKYLHMYAPDEPTSDIGVYFPDVHVIVVDTAKATGLSLSHEITHVLVRADMPLAPLWLEEGISSLFEAPRFDADGTIHGRAHFRLQTLRDALASPKTAPEVRLDTLFALATPESFREGGKEYVHYAESREAMRWLDSRHQLWAFYTKWRRDVLDDPSGAASFASVVGKSPSDATADWVAWLQSDEAKQ
jgi:hypothetical protein